VSDAKLGTGMKYGKIMAWTPAILVILGLVMLAVSEVTLGVAIIAFALLTLFYVSRRRKSSPGGRPAGNP